MATVGTLAPRAASWASGACGPASGSASRRSLSRASTASRSSRVLAIPISTFDGWLAQQRFCQHRLGVHLQRLPELSLAQADPARSRKALLGSRRQRLGRCGTATTVPTKCPIRHLERLKLGVVLARPLDPAAIELPLDRNRQPPAPDQQPPSDPVIRA
jgi:hypothetical protein